MNNFLSIDLESWAMPNIPDFLALSSLEKKKIDQRNVVESTLKILQILKRNKLKITFFIVGQIYEWYPELVEKISSQGHEIAYHSHNHDPIPNSESLEKQINQSKKFIQKFKPIGFRAPRITLNYSYFKILKKYGFKYDSSMYDLYRNRQKIDGIVELPVTSFYKLPLGSGYFVGLLGKKIEIIYKKINQTGDPVVSFLHNWQILRPKHPSFPTIKYLLSHPHYFPYQANCSESFAYIVSKFTFLQMKNLL